MTDVRKENNCLIHACELNVKAFPAETVYISCVFKVLMGVNAIFA